MDGWLIFALGSAGFAALTAIFGKLGVAEILAGCDSPKLAALSLCNFFLWIPGSLLRGVFISSIILMPQAQQMTVSGHSTRTVSVDAALLQLLVALVLRRSHDTREPHTPTRSSAHSAPPFRLVGGLEYVRDTVGTNYNP